MTACHEPDALADWMDQQAANVAHTFPARAVQFQLVASRLRLDASMRRQFRALLVFTMEADSVAAVSDALDRLHAWSLGQLSDHEFAGPSQPPAG